jgi:hypothetical protein
MIFKVYYLYLKGLIGFTGTPERYYSNPVIEHELTTMRSCMKTQCLNRKKFVHGVKSEISWGPFELRKSHSHGCIDNPFMEDQSFILAIVSFSSALQNFGICWRSGVPYL